MRSHLRVFLGCILLVSGSALGQVQGEASEETTNVRAATSAEYRGHIVSLKMPVGLREGVGELPALVAGDSAPVPALDHLDQQLSA